VAAIYGCASEVDEEMPKRAVHAFEGEVSKEFVGDWKASDNMSGLNLKEDGSAEILAVTMSQSGRNESKLPGEWKVNEKDLLLKYKSGNSDVVLKYAAELKGDSLKLVQAGNGHTTTYKR
jgi:hypothetical protein